MSKALIQIGRKESNTIKKVEIELDRSLFSELNDYAKFAKIPGRVLKDKRERLVIAMIERVLQEDKAFKEYRAAQKINKTEVAAELVSEVAKKTTVKKHK